MVVEMIARQVGEQCDVECHAVDASLIDAVRRNLHGHDFRALGPDLAQEFLQLRGIRRRVRCGRQRTPQAVAERADHRRAPSGDIEPGRNPLRTRGLAVRAGNANHPQLARRMAVHHVRDAAEPRLQIVDREMRQFPFAVPAESLGIPQDRAGAAADRIGDEPAPVLMRSAIRREGIARAHVPAVGSDARNRHGELREQRSGLGVGRRRYRSDHVSSCTSAASAGGRMELSGASVGTPSSRNAAPMTLLKTGAATLPP